MTTTHSTPARNAPAPQPVPSQGREAQYRECAAAGLTNAQTAEKLGVARAAVSQFAKRHGVEFRSEVKRKQSATPPEKKQTHGSDRVKFWSTPKKPEDWPNSLHDAFASLPSGKILVYRHGVPSLLSGKPAPENRIATSVAARLGGALVQWPQEPCHGDQNKVRTWCYGIQKRGAA